MQKSHLPTHISENFEEVQFPHKTELRQSHRRASDGDHKGSILFTQEVVYLGIFKDISLSYWISLPKAIKPYLMEKTSVM